MNSALSLSVVIPLHDGARYAPRVIGPLREAVARGTVREVVVVDDGSTDGAGELYRAAGFEVLAQRRRKGPATCRNIGVQKASGDVVLFVDADVAIAPDVPERALEVLTEDPGCVAVIGSYDANPPAPGLVSQYRNLLHHHIHQKHEGEVDTFWTGCGAVRRAAFLDVGGFDARRFPRPSIEDIEFGYRLHRNAGRIRLSRGIRATHLKEWSFAKMIRTDILDRALPWGRLLMESDYGRTGLNLCPAERCRALLGVLLVPTALVSGFHPPLALLLAALILLQFLANWSFYALCWRRNGLIALVAAFGLHQLYYLYSTLVYVFCSLEAQLHRLRTSWTRHAHS